jgi:hypothetical protein
MGKTELAETINPKQVANYFATALTTKAYGEQSSCETVTDML